MSGAAIRRRAPGWRSLAVLMVGAGTLHLVSPRTYTAIVPRQLGDPLPWVYVSGVAEIACGAALVDRRSRALAGLATAVLLVAVLPANVQMAVTALRSDTAGPLAQVLTVLRLPLQVPLVLWALAVRRRAREVAS